MKVTISNIRTAYNDTRRFANTTSNTGLVEFTHAVRKIVYDYHDELPYYSKMEVYRFIKNKMIEKGWDGYKFNK